LAILSKGNGSRFLRWFSKRWLITFHTGFFDRNHPIDTSILKRHESALPPMGYRVEYCLVGNIGSGEYVGNTGNSY
jgi:hypothetical protein